jgi:P-type E1-E2 ATPase
MYQSQQPEFEMTELGNPYMSQVPFEGSNKTYSDKELSKEILSDFNASSKEDDKSQSSSSKKSEKSASKDSSIIEVGWKDLMVGDVVFVKKDHYFPADLLLLGSSDKNGNVYVETKNLDGERNLKLKRIPELLSDKMRILDRKKRGKIMQDTRKSKLGQRMSISFENVNKFATIIN